MNTISRPSKGRIAVGRSCDYIYSLPKVLTEMVARLTGGGKPLNEDLTALCHSP
jgi:hypothetical protein